MRLFDTRYVDAPQPASAPYGSLLFRQGTCRPDGGRGVRSRGAQGAEHVEIISPGGPYGEVTPDNFGQPGLVDYRNPNLADAMRVTGLVQRYGAGLPTARDALRANAQHEPRFDVTRSG